MTSKAISCPCHQVLFCKGSSQVKQVTLYVRHKAPVQPSYLSKKQTSPDIIMAPSIDYYNHRVPTLSWEDMAKESLTNFFSSKINLFFGKSQHFLIIIT